MKILKTKVEVIDRDLKIKLDNLIAGIERQGYLFQIRAILENSGEKLEKSLLKF